MHGISTRFIFPHWHVVEHIHTKVLVSDAHREFLLLNKNPLAFDTNTAIVTWYILQCILRCAYEFLFLKSMPTELSVWMCLLILCWWSCVVFSASIPFDTIDDMFLAAGPCRLPLPPSSLSVLLPSHSYVGVVWLHYLPLSSLTQSGQQFYDLQIASPRVTI